MPVVQGDPRIQRCGFAKLLGDGLEYYVKKYEVTMGRRSKSTELDVVLGDNMNISRKHACIRFNFEKGCFELVVLGKNGVTVGGVLHTPTSPPLELHSQDFVQMGDRSFYFLLPKDVSRLGPPQSKKQRVGIARNSGSTKGAVPVNGGAEIPMKVDDTEMHEVSSSPSPGRKQKWSFTNGSSERSDVEYDDVSQSHAADELVVSGTGLRRAGVEDGQMPTEKNGDGMGSPTLVFTNPPSGIMHTAQLYQPGSRQPLG